MKAATDTGPRQKERGHLYGIPRRAGGAPGSWRRSDSMPYKHESDRQSVPTVV